MFQGRTHRYLKFALYLVLVVLLNIAAQSVFGRWDLTEDNMYSLSAVSKDVVSSLSEPLTVKAFFSQELPPPYNTYRQYLGDLLREYGQYAGENFNYELIQVSPDAQAKQDAAQSYGIQPVQVQVVEEDSLSYKKVYMGAVLIHGDAVEKIPTIDSIKDLEYTLTSSMHKLRNKVSALLSLDSPVQVKLIMSPSLQDIAPAMGVDSLPKLPEKVQSIVQELNKENYGQLQFTKIQPQDPSRIKAAVSQYDVQKLQWPAFPESDIAAGNGVIGLVVEHGDAHRTLSLLNVTRMPLLGTQYSLTKPARIRELLNLNLKSLLGINQSLGYLADHGTPSINPMARSQRSDGLSVNTFQQLASKNYTLQEVRLEEGIPEGLQCLLIAGPDKEFSEYELYQIDQALMQGTNLAIFQDSFVNTSKSPRQPPQFTTNDTGLNKLLAHYGLKQEKALVFDRNCYKQQIPQQRGGGEQPIYFAPLIKKENINHKLPYLHNINGLVAFKNAPVRLRQERMQENGLQGSILFSSSSKSWTKTSNISLNPMAIAPPQDSGKLSSYPLAARVSGKFPSYFVGQEIPSPEKDKKTKAGEQTNSTKLPQKLQQEAASIQASGQKLDRSQPAQVLLIGSASMLSDTILDTQGQGPNSVLIMNLIDALNGRTAMASLRSKVQEFNPLRDTSTQVKSVVKAINIVALPVAVVLFGLVVWVLRGRRKQRIQKMFS